MASGQKQKLKLIASGRVQGVGFRRFVEKKANLYNIAGCVKNNADGSVVIEACAEQEELKIFMEAVKKGGIFSRVDELIVESKETVNEHEKGFKVSF